MRTDGKRTDRKDGGQYTREKFERRIFPAISDVAIAEVRKADVLAVLVALEAEGKLRTANVLLADLKQTMRSLSCATRSRAALSKALPSSTRAAPRRDSNVHSPLTTYRRPTISGKRTAPFDAQKALR